MPKPFRFNLERILDLRAQLEERAKMELGKAIAAHRRQEEAVAGLTRELADREEAMAQKAAVTPAELWLWRAYKERLVGDIRAAKARLEELAAARERCRRTAVERSKDRKLLDKLKTKKAMRHALDENLGEQKENDEMASVRYQPPAL